MVWKIFKLATSPKFGSLIYRVSTEMEYQCQPLWKKLKNGCHFVNIHCMETFQITNPLQFLVSSFSECWWKWNISVSHYEKWLPFSIILNIRKNFKLLNPPKFGSPVFWVSTEMEYEHWPLWKKLKNGCHFVQITDPPPKFGSPVFQVSTETEYQCQPIWKKLKNDCHFISIDHMEKIQITDPPKVWVSGFLSVNRKRNISIGQYEKIEKMTAILLILIVRKISNYWPPKVWVSGFSFLSVDGNGMSSENQRCKFSFFLNFPLVHFPPSPIIGSISTFMRGYT